MKVIIVTGGGTAGHINPAIDIAKSYIQNGYKVVYAGNSGNMEESIVAKYEGIIFEDIDSPKINRKKIIDNALFFYKYRKSFIKSRNIIKKYKPEFVFATGGYVCVPICKAALKENTRYYLHEQNSIAGLANRYLSKKAKCVFTSFKHTTGFKSNIDCKFTGNPRTQIVYESLKQSKRRKNGRILVVSGSLGSQVVNDVIVDMVNEYDDLRVDIVTGTKYYDDIKGRITNENVNVQPYVDNIAVKFAEYSLIITRSGATTLAELIAAGTKTILIPSPNVVKDHQTLNANQYKKIIESRVIQEEVVSYRKLANEVYSNLTYLDSSAEIKDSETYFRSLTALNNILECIGET